MLKRLPIIALIAISTAVPFLATAFGTFLLRQSFLQVPQDLRDAAALLRIEPADHAAGGAASRASCAPARA